MNLSLLWILPEIKRVSFSVDFVSASIVDKSLEVVCVLFIAFFAKVKEDQDKGNHSQNADR